MSGRQRIWELIGPCIVVLAVAVGGSLTSRAFQFQVQSVLVTTCIVVAIYVFVGNSGVLSFGHVSFVALGAFAAGLATVPAVSKRGSFPHLAPVLADLELGNLASLLVAAAVGGVAAFVVGIPIVRLSGLSAGIATFAVLMIVGNLLGNWEFIGPGAKTLPLVPRTTDFRQATATLLFVIVVAYGYQRSPAGRKLRAVRDDEAAAQASGIDERRSRLAAFTLSGTLCGLAGGVLVHLLGSITTEQVYLDLTFTTLAMLVVGGVGSLWGAVVGGLAVAGLNSLLAEAERGQLFGLDATLPSGLRFILLGAIMLVTLMFRPSGLTGSQELSPLLARRQR